MERSGHPVLGAIAGFFFFLFLGLAAMAFGIVPFDGPWLVLPVIGIVLGALWGTWAPIGRKRVEAVQLVPTLPTGEPTGQAWTVRPVTGEVPVVGDEPTGVLPAELPAVERSSESEDDSLASAPTELVWADEARAERPEDDRLP
jgi:hypothetical protein